MLYIVRYASIVIICHCRVKKTEKSDTCIIASLHKITQFREHLFYEMDRIRWSEKVIPLRSLVDNSAIQKPALGK